ncbi:MAG TPA: hydrolase TatD [Clostridiaceae bacterium]|jgi:TatD DNase family protein|nr:hydrolase TatD [Clostridiaceae bacterium]HBF76890.1 hydrolase TatD [Clostridiaceae bacterium]HBG38055.1 hydrolase TatD [Clostridiaceae bacterium]HBN28833.1 hydrolase TatD [Clostridiaceae bacterium]HBX48047.1 hydrolase TatD [Clostridiaceae bacterium]
MDNIFDSHAHYDDEAFNEDREEVIQKIQNAGVKRVLNCSSSIKSMYTTLELCKKYDFIYGAFGVHPEFALDALQNKNKIGDILSEKKAKAVGEIGLDYYYEGYDRETQIKSFKEQMDLARSFNLPVVIHSREAFEDTLNVIKEFKGVKGVLHCYSGSVEFAKEVLKCGYYLGFTGVITFKNAKKAIEVLKSLPKDKILVETDCPYMTPEPNRGKRNDSSYLLHTLNKMSEVLNITYSEAAKLTFGNASELFKIE